METATAVLFLTEDRVYKVHKPVNLGFVDFRGRQERLAACEEEVRLNRRLAPDVYLGVADIRTEAGQPREHMVVMRRLPRERRLSELVRGGLDATDELRAIARRMADFHEHCETSPEISDAGSLASLEARWLEAMDAVAPFRGRLLDADVVDEIGRLALGYLVGRGPLIAERQRAGRVRDGHGDLLAEDIYCLADGPRVLDCLNLDRRLRFGDVLADVAFLAMDLERLGAPAAARLFLDSYREYSGETHPASLEHFYIAYRAFVRTRIACLRHHQGDPEAAEEARALADLALRHLRQGRVRLVLVSGLPGTGASTLARNLAASEDEWVLLSTDDAARPAGPSGLPLSTSALAQALEPAEQGHQELLDLAWHALVRGQSVVLDLPWPSRDCQDAVVQAAEECDADLIRLRSVAPPRLAVARTAARRAVRACGTGAVLSDLAIAAYLDAAEHRDPWPAAHRIDTTVPIQESVAAARHHVA